MTRSRAEQDRGPGAGPDTAASAGPVPPEFVAGFPETLAEISRSCRTLSRTEPESRRALGARLLDWPSKPL